VEKVFYPGLPSHPQHALAQRQMHGSGGMVTAVLKGTLDDTTRFLERCEIFALAESLGGVESLIEHPAIMTHASLPAEVRADLGIGDGLIPTASPRVPSLSRFKARERAMLFADCRFFTSHALSRCTPLRAGFQGSNSISLTMG
jgi:hypothetical protein